MTERESEEETSGEENKYRAMGYERLRTRRAQRKDTCLHGMN